MQNYQWYQHLKRPSWAPPSWVFGPVWTFLYVLIAISFGTVFIKAFQGVLPSMVALPFILNLIFNVIYTPLQFGLKNNALALFDVALVVGTLIWAMISIHSYLPWVTYLSIPYLLWASFATFLQATITSMN